MILYILCFISFYYCFLFIIIIITTRIIILLLWRGEERGKKGEKIMIREKDIGIEEKKNRYCFKKRGVKKISLF